MIQEIKNFIEHISEGNEEVFSKNLKLRPRIYVLLDIEKQGREYILTNEKAIFDTEEDVLVYDGKEVDNLTLYEDFLFKQTNSIVVGRGKNKSFNSSSGIFMFTATPFGIGLKKGKFSEFIDSNKAKLEESIRVYFDSAHKYGIEKQAHLTWTDQLQGFCEQKLLNLIPQLPAYDQLKKNEYIFVFLKGPQTTDFVERHEAYLNAKVFNDKEYNKELKSEVYGVSDSLSGFNQKKIFLQHHTAPLEYNYRVNGQIARQVWRFFQLQSNRQIPNPIPVFIDQRELNGKMVAIFQDDETGKISHSDLVKSLLLHSKRDLENYYLIYFDSRAKGSKVHDIDFVSQFRYEERGVKIIEVFSRGGNQANNKIETVFDIENLVFKPIFNQKHGWLNYFSEIKIQKPEEAISKTQLRKYRKSVYDFIYKSRRSSITSAMFDDMMQHSILDDIRRDVIKDNKYSREDSIKEKLNIWFSLYDFFINTTSKPRTDMVNHTEELLEGLQSLCEKDNEEHIQDDSTFAFAVGQIVHYLLNQSESSNRTHALLEPFLQKTDAQQLKTAIARTFATYKHAITFYRRKYAFDKLMSEVMGYEPDEKNMKNLLPMILAGYFSKSIMEKSKEE